LRKLIRAHLGFFSEKPHLMRVLLNDSSGLGRDRHQEIAALKQLYFELAREVLGAALESRGAVLDPSALDRYTHIFLAMLNARLSPFDGAANERADELARAIEDVALGAFSWPDPRDVNGEP